MGEVLLHTRLSRYGAVETLYVFGELDVATGPVLEHAVVQALDGQGGEFRLDLSELTFVDSTGMKTLISLHNRVDSLGRRLVIVSPTRPVRRVIALMGLDEVLDVRPPNVPTVVPLLADSTDAG
jgi:anti-sigma B factor antagonist